MASTRTLASPIARALDGCRQGRPESFDDLVTLLYPELRRIARAKLRRLPAGQTLNTTGLVHETYVKMCGVDDFEDQRHFLAASARAMRFILVDAARKRLAAKRGGGASDATWDDDAIGSNPAGLVDTLGVAELMGQLRGLDPRLGDVVDCIFYAGFTQEETALALGVSERTVRREWQRARAWLRRGLEPRATAGGGL